MIIIGFWIVFDGFYWFYWETLNIYDFSSFLRGFYWEVLKIAWLLGWCALGSATGGKHVSAISHSSTFPIEIHKSGIVTEVWKRTLLLVCETGYLRFRIWTKMHQAYFSNLSARVPSGSLPQSVLNEFSARFHSLYSVAQPESALFVGTYANVSASSARSHQLYQNANVFSLERSFSSAPKVQQLDICIQRRSRSQANGRSDFRIAAFAQSEYAVFDETFECRAVQKCVDLSNEY